MSIYTKLFDIQQEIGAISKDSKNPFYNSAYFDINSLIAQLMPLLKKNKVLLTQPIENGTVMTRLYCIEKGNFVEGGIPLPDIADPQKMGGAITYYRRYTLASLLGLQAQDDDGNSTINSATSKPMLSQAGLDYILTKGTKQDGIDALTKRTVKPEHQKLIKAKFKI